MANFKLSLNAVMGTERTEKQQILQKLSKIFKGLPVPRVGVEPQEPVQNSMGVGTGTTTEDGSLAKS